MTGIDSIIYDVILVMDTDVVIAGFRSPGGASAELLRWARQGRFSMAISVALVLEYEAVATRPEHLKAMDRDRPFVEKMIDAIVAIGLHTQIDFRHRPQTKDPDDEMVLETAINASADGIVTFNRRDFKAAERFGIACLLPRDALEKMR